MRQCHYQKTIIIVPKIESNERVHTNIARFLSLNSSRSDVATAEKPCIDVAAIAAVRTKHTNLNKPNDE